MYALSIGEQIDGRLNTPLPHNAKAFEETISEAHMKMAKESSIKLLFSVC